MLYRRVLYTLVCVAEFSMETAMAFLYGWVLYGFLFNGLMLYSRLVNELVVYGWVLMTWCFISGFFFMNWRTWC